MLKSSRDNDEGTCRSGDGEGGGGPYVTPDLSFYCWGGSESSARKVNRTGNYFFIFIF